MQIIKKIDNRR